MSIKIQYWLKVYNNNDKLLPGSDDLLLGRTFDIVEFDNRFNELFICNDKAVAVELILLNGFVSKRYVVDFRDNNIVFKECHSNKTYGVSEFRHELLLLHNACNDSSGNISDIKLLN